VLAPAISETLVAALAGTFIAELKAPSRIAGLFGFHTPDSFGASVAGPPRVAVDSRLSSMEGRVSRRLKQGVGSAVVALLLVMSAAVVARSTTSQRVHRSAWDAPATAHRLAFVSSIGGLASASLPVCDDPAVFKQYTELRPYEATQACAGRLTFYTAEITEFCDADQEPIISPASPPASGGSCGFENCQNPQCIAFPQSCVPNQWALDGQVGSGLSCGTQIGSCCRNAPPEPTLICRNVCPPPAQRCPPPGASCPDGVCEDCELANPISLPAAELDSEFRLFPLGESGFPSSFSLFWRSRKSVPTSNAAEPLGGKMFHSFSHFLWKGMDSAGRGYVRATLADGAVISFKYDPAVTAAWVGEEARHGTLVAAPPGLPCAPTATIELPSGDIYRFHDFCGEDGPLEGTIQRVDFRSGDYLSFEVEPTAGLITAVSNRRGQRVELAYSGPDLPAEAAHFGLLQSVKAPDGSTFRFVPGPNGLQSISGPDGVLYTLEIDRFQQLLSVRDAKNQLDRRWTYFGAAPASESGPGESVGNNTVRISGNEASVSISFVPSGESAEITNVYELGPAGDALSHVTGRTLLGSCPGCGNTNLARSFWEGTNDVRAVRDARGSITAFLDWDAAGPCETSGCHDLAYGAAGEALVVYEGCSGTVELPDCSAGRRVEYAYIPGTRVLVSSSRPGAVPGQRVIDARFFDGSSSRVVLQRRTGWTAGTLGGPLDTLRTRSTRYTYGGAPASGAIELTTVEGPFDDDGSGFPSSGATPRTDYAYYGPGVPDACSGALPAPGQPNHNLHRLKSVTRFVDSAGSRTLVTTYCAIDGAGRPTILVNADNTRTELTYDFRGNVTRTVVDGDGLHLVTDSLFDKNENLVEVRLPRTTSKGRTGVRYLHNDADWVVAVQTGFFPASGPFVVEESMTMEYDPWGNRTSTVYRDASGAAVTRESATYDRFNRLSRIQDGDAPRRTVFGYDEEGDLTSVEDAQTDRVAYGSVEDLSRYDRFGRLSRVQQEICDRPFTDPEAPCFPYPVNVDYGYDEADQLRRVDVEDTVRGGTITTSYVIDDFGQTTKVTSPDSGTSASRFDGAGRLVESRDARGKVFRYQYDRLSRLVRKVNASPVTVAASDPDHGSVTVDPDGNVLFIPEPNFSGSGSFNYTVNGRNGDTSTGTATVTVNPINDAPIAHSKMTAGIVGASVDFVLRGEDLDDCELTFSVLSAPALGTIDAFTPLACTPGVITDTDEVRVTYTGATTGFDEFRFAVSDGEFAAEATVVLVVTESGAALLGVHTEAHSAGGPDVIETLDDGSCTEAPCALTSFGESVGPNSGAFGFARASRGSLAAKSGGTAQTGSVPADASFAAEGSGFFTLPDLVFTGPDPTVCVGGMNLLLNGSLAASLSGSGTITAGVSIRVNIAGTSEFTGSLVTDGVMLDGQGLLAGVVDTENLLLTTPRFCVPAGEPVPLTLEIATAVDASLFGASLLVDALSDYSNTFSFAETGAIFELPPGFSVDSESGGIEDNLWVSPIQAIAIDVKPGNPENVIPCHNANALIPTALLTTPEFDALTVDADTVRFEGGAEIHRDNAGLARRHVEDVDGDGDLDLMFHFRLSDTSLTCDSAVGSLTGSTYSGLLIVGSDLLTMKEGGKP